ncbi:unannotated protein [freshwater metagenome]|uniref:Unannotated protein n=1 Tax=freshwater metagenome TaxID=449393 RepID=A0A6J7CB26_9ZZZZ
MPEGAFLGSLRDGVLKHAAVTIALLVAGRAMALGQLAVVLKVGAHVALVRLHECQDVGHDLEDHEVGGNPLGDARLLLGQEGVDELLVEPVEDLVLGVEVMVERWLANPHRLGDVVHRRLVVAGPVEQPRGLLENFGASPLGGIALSGLGCGRHGFTRHEYLLYIASFRTAGISM